MRLKFERNNEFKNRYQNILKQINELSTNLKNDDDKIKLLGLINKLTYYASEIEPQESVDWYNKHYK